VYFPVSTDKSLLVKFSPSSRTYWKASKKTKVGWYCVAFVDGLIHYQGLRNTFSNTKMTNTFPIFFLDVSDFYGTSWASRVWMGLPKLQYETNLNDEAGRNSWTTIVCDLNESEDVTVLLVDHVCSLGQTLQVQLVMEVSKSGNFVGCQEFCNFLVKGIGRPLMTAAAGRRFRSLFWGGL
jgi:hypothetical protein